MHHSRDGMILGIGTFITGTPAPAVHICGISARVPPATLSSDAPLFQYVDPVHVSDNLHAMHDDQLRLVLVVVVQRDVDRFFGRRVDPSVSIL